MKDKTIALIAGATRGAGKGIAIELARNDIHCIIVGRSTNKIFPHPLGTIEDTLAEIKDIGGTGEAICCDCSIESQVDDLMKQIEKKYGRLDLVVNSAWGGHDTQLEPGNMWDKVSENWHFMFDKGVWNYLLVSCKSIPLLSKGRKPLLINVSFWDDDKYTGSLFYDLSKSTMNRMSLAFSMENKDQKITSIALSPGYMKTERVMEALEKDPSLAETFGIPSESTAYIGKAVYALYKDPLVLAKSGKCLRVGDLAREYDFYDIDGSQPPPFKLP
jgi:NAD(P)-dependent dehydrogenase (short-subunit alcohol dehydrogenase family)